MKLRLAALLGALALLPRSARADDASDVSALLDEPVVDAASRTRETAATAPATSSVITAEDLRRYGIRSLDEAINFLSLGMYTTRPLHAVEIGSRGVLLSGDYGNHVLLLVDGHTLNEPWNGTAYFERGAAIPIELVDHIEVILGPGSVTHGSSAMLGVINVVTKRAKDYSGVHLVADGEIPTLWKLGAGAGVSFKLLGAPAEVTTQFETVRQDGPAFRFGPQSGSTDGVTGQPKRFSPSGPATGVWGGLANNSYSSRVNSAYTRLAVGRLELAIRAATYERATPYLDSLVGQTGDFNDPSNRELDRWLSADAKYHFTLSTIADLRVRAYADSYDYRMYSTSSAAEDCSTDSPAGCRTTIRGASKWGGTELVATFDWTRDGKWTSLVGTDVRLERIEASTTSADLATGTRTATPGASTELNKRFAAFGEQRARPIRWLYFTAGLRGDIAEGYPGALSPRASVAVEPWQAGTLKAVYAEAFRAPSSYERRYQDVTQIMADRLEPERVRTVQASFEQRLGGHRVLFGVFQSWWTDLVDAHPLTSAELEAARARGLIAPGQDSVSQYQNVDSMRNHGWEGAVEGTLAGRRFRYGLNVTGAYSRHMTDGQETPVTVTPSLFGNARVAYDLGGALPTLALAGQLAARRPADLAFDSAFKPVPYAPARVELRAAITGAFPHVPGLSYRVTGQKAFATREAYVIGPNQSGATGGAAELAPIDNELRVGLGLTYNLGW